MFYSVIALLGEWQGYTLTLAGIAGVIVSIGLTADSYIVIFEKLKDETRDSFKLPIRENAAPFA